MSPMMAVAPNLPISTLLATRRREAKEGGEGTRRVGGLKGCVLTIRCLFVDQNMASGPYGSVEVASKCWVVVWNL